MKIDRVYEPSSFFLLAFIIHMPLIAMLGCGIQAMTPSQRCQMSAINTELKQQASCRAMRTCKSVMSLASAGRQVAAAAATMRSCL